ncbi:LLM class flavin-dependent oxidoreductase [Streptomyces orinoci]|uniref:LLM class flavin-dependent oxidoreductase n=1 Tax=Streptomyces orinoci TaxID=67339 RepID=A0ABV3JUU4_STRON|nr:LLM class flavin-dependent oxidoreductase [Streptomyces orinoci]
MRILVKVSASTEVAILRERVARWLDAGIEGVVAGDHLFAVASSTAKSPEQSRVEPYVLLAAVSALSDRLDLATIVSNYTIRHPVHLLREVAQLVALAGAERVWAGFGAGWNAIEYEAVGRTMLPLSDRLRELDRTVGLARALFAGEIVTEDGVAAGLPLSPAPAAAPRFLFGGGSSGLLELAARHGDHLDVNTPPGIEPQSASRSGWRARDSDSRRRLRTPVAAVRDHVFRWRELRRALGREDAGTTSVTLSTLRLCRREEKNEYAERYARALGVPGINLDDCAYALVGEREELRERLAQRYADGHLDWLVVPDSEDALRLREEVLAPAGLG